MGRSLTFTSLSVLFVALACSFAPVAAQAAGGKTAVDAELTLAVDISYSMDEQEQKLQRAGYVAALTSPEFLTAVKSGPTGRIAVEYVQWASYSDQNKIVDWTVIDDETSAKAFADRLSDGAYRRAMRTSISGAIDASMHDFDDNGFNGARRIIDVSGDGPNNDGRPVAEARDAAVAKGVTINGLPLVSVKPYLGPADIADLDVYYKDCVIGGEDAFMIPIHSVTNFVEATRSKLVREVAWRAPHLPIQRAAAQQPGISCTIGENLWRHRWGN